jgi:hypothetical protein
MVLGQARSLAGNQPGAHVEWRAAQRSFEEFGASRWAERAAAAVEKGFPASPAEPPRADEPSLFRCDGDTRTIRFDGTQVLVRDLKGFRYLERLLAEPNREFHVLDLVAVERGSLPTTPTAHEPGLETTGGHAGLHLDDEAREAYRRRLADIDEDIEDATRMNDLGRLELAQHDRDYLVAELSRAVGLGGRGRLAAATAERARTSVTRTLRYAMTRIEEHHPGLGHHLALAVATGTYCVYQPDPRLPVSWEV